MSKINAEALLKKVTEDKALKEKMTQAGSSGFAAFSKAEGLDCTLEEFVEAAKITATQRLHDKMTSIHPDSNVGVGNISVI